LTSARFLVPQVPSGDLYTLDGPEGHHAATVMRLAVGEPLSLGDGQGSTVDGVVVATGKGTLTIALGERHHEPSPSPRLVVVQGIAKGERGELAVQAMTEIGVDAIVPWSAARSVAQWRAERGEKSRQRWVDTAREAAKQSRRAWLPEIAEAADTRTVAKRLSEAALGLVLHEAAETRLSIVELPEPELAQSDIVAVVGPEGGITDDELSAFSGAGAVVVRLGQSILRTSTAGPAALAVLAARLGRW
jgi:16S rRNA (uracil1498-N3)-methyltransferase